MTENIIEKITQLIDTPGSAIPVNTETTGNLVAAIRQFRARITELEKQQSTPPTPSPIAQGDKYTIEDVTGCSFDDTEHLEYCDPDGVDAVCEDADDCPGHDNPAKHRWMVNGMIPDVDKIENDEGWYFTKRTAQLFADALNGKLVPCVVSIPSSIAQGAAESVKLHIRPLLPEAYQLKSSSQLPMESLMKWIVDDIQTAIDADRREGGKTIIDRNARIVELKVALKPFADLGDQFPETLEKRGCECPVPIVHLRRASSIYNPKEPPNDQ